MAAHWVLEDHDGLTALEPKRADNITSIVSAELLWMDAQLGGEFPCEGELYPQLD